MDKLFGKLSDSMRIVNISDILDYLWVYLITAGMLMAFLSIG